MASFGKKRHTRNYQAIGQYGFDKAQQELIKTSSYGNLSDIIGGQLFNIQNSFTSSADLLTRSKSEKRTGEVLNYGIAVVMLFVFLGAIVFITKTFK